MFPVSWKRLSVLMVLILTCAMIQPVWAAKKIHFASVTWTGVTVKTELAKNILTSLGYETRSSNLSVPIIYQALSTGDADIFLGNWMPSMETIANKFFEQGSVVKYVANMSGAKYTLAAPAYVVDGGLKDFADIAKFADELEHKIFGLEPGNDGNQIIKGMIDADQYGLGDFKIVATSEPIMLTEVQNYVRDKKWVVFLGWSPHYMNQIIDMEYLTGSTAATFGDNDGTATVYTNVRKGFVSDYPNVAVFLKNLIFPIDMMNEISQLLHDDKTLNHEKAGLKWIKQHPEVYRGWFEGVTTVDGKPSLPAFEDFLLAH